MRRSTLVASLALFLFACGPDAGTTPDAGAGPDAGDRADGGAPSDGGGDADVPVIDAGAPMDGGADAGPIDGGVDDGGAHDSGSDAGAPPGPADRFGTYAWGFDREQLTAGTRPLPWAVDLVKDLGTHVIRITLGASDPYGSNAVDAETLTQYAQSPEYAALFDDPQFQIGRAHV